MIHREFSAIHDLAIEVDPDEYNARRYSRGSSSSRQSSREPSPHTTSPISSPRTSDAGEAPNGPHYMCRVCLSKTGKRSTIVDNHLQKPSSGICNKAYILVKAKLKRNKHEEQIILETVRESINEARGQAGLSSHRSIPSPETSSVDFSPPNLLLSMASSNTSTSAGRLEGPMDASQTVFHSQSAFPSCPSSPLSNTSGCSNAGGGAGSCVMSDGPRLFNNPQSQPISSQGSVQGLALADQFSSLVLPPSMDSQMLNMMGQELSFDLMARQHLKSLISSPFQDQGPALGPQLDALLRRSPSPPTLFPDPAFAFSPDPQLLSGMGQDSLEAQERQHLSAMVNESSVSALAAAAGRDLNI